MRMPWYPKPTKKQRAQRKYWESIGRACMIRWWVNTAIKDGNTAIRLWDLTDKERAILEKAAAVLTAAEARVREKISAI